MYIHAKFQDTLNNNKVTREEAELFWPTLVTDTESLIEQADISTPGYKSQRYRCYVVYSFFLNYY